MIIIVSHLRESVLAPGIHGSPILVLSISVNSYAIFRSFGTWLERDMVHTLREVIVVLLSTIIPRRIQINHIQLRLCDLALQLVPLIRSMSVLLIFHDCLGSSDGLEDALKGELGLEFGNALGVEV